MKKFNLLVLAVICILFTSAQTVATLENLTLNPESYWNGSDLSANGFASGNAYFVNSYDTAWGGSWSGFAYSNVTDDTTAGFGNQYSAITGSGYAGSANYAVANGYGDMKVKLTGNAAGGRLVTGAYITNATYAYLSMKTGDQFAKKFGGANGTDADWFKVTVVGWLNGALKQQSIDFMLADFTSPDSTQDYIVNDWQWLNLQPMGNVDSLMFTLSSSDTGQFGMNTPAYFILDNFTTADEANVAPVVVNDYATTDYNTPVTINVLANDFDTTATPLTVTTTGAGLIQGSSVTVNGNNELVYTPAVGIQAIDTVLYSLCDNGGLCTTGKVAINVTGITGVEDVIANAVNVYPNPFSNQLRITAANALSEITLFDLNGRQMNTVVSINGNTANINTAEVAAGMYVVRAVSANGTSFTKVSK